MFRRANQIIRSRKTLFFLTALVLVSVTGLSVYFYSNSNVETIETVHTFEDSPSSLLDSLEQSKIDVEEQAGKYRKLYDSLESYEQFLELSEDEKNFVHVYTINSTRELAAEIQGYYRTDGSVAQQFESYLWCYDNSQGKAKIDCEKAARGIAENNGYLEEGMEFDIEEYVGGEER